MSPLNSHTNVIGYSDNFWIFARIIVSKKGMTELNYHFL